MQRTKQVTYTNTYTKVEAVSCDICGATVENWGKWSTHKGVATITVEREEFDELDNVQVDTEYDICPDCFWRYIEKVIKDKSGQPRVSVHPATGLGELIWDDDEDE